MMGTPTKPGGVLIIILLLFYTYLYRWVADFIWRVFQKNQSWAWELCGCLGRKAGRNQSFSSFSGWSSHWHLTEEKLDEELDEFSWQLLWAEEQDQAGLEIWEAELSFSLAPAFVINFSCLWLSRAVRLQNPNQTALETIPSPLPIKYQDISLLEWGWWGCWVFMAELREIN